MLDRLVGFAIVIATLGLAAPSNATAEAKAQFETSKVVIPFDASRKHLAIKVHINGQGPFDFNVDTYASCEACVDHELAKRLELPIVGTAQNGDGSGKTVQRDLVGITELSLGGATFTEVTALVDDYRWVTAPDGDPIDGLIGYELFKRLLLTVDYPNHRIEFSRGALDADEHTIEGVSNDGTPDVTLTIGDREFHVGIDTGSTGTLSLPADRFDELTLASEPRLVGRARTVYSTEDIFDATLAERVGLAGFTREDQVVSSSKLFGHPLLGYGILRDYAVTFDQVGGRIRFARPTND